MKKQYTYEILQKLTEELRVKMEKQTADQKEAFLAVAAAHTLDFLNLARDNQLKLNLTLETEDNVAAVLVRLHFLNTQQGMSTEDSRMTLLKKLGGYELFTIYNGIAELSSGIGFDVKQNRLVLAYKNGDGSIVQFDVYGELEKVLNTFQLSSKDEEFNLFGSLAPFYDSMTQNFLTKLQ